jgi:hypothetical protein
MAILGSTVLVPTVMSFLGMFFFAKSGFENPPFLAVFVFSLLWAFVIMTTDKILITMYRPFQPLWKRATQATFRQFLASLSSALRLPSRFVWTNTGPPSDSSTKPSFKGN